MTQCYAYTIVVIQEYTFNGSVRPDNERTFGTSRRYTDIVIAVQYHCPRNVRFNWESDISFNQLRIGSHQHIDSHSGTGGARFKGFTLTGNGVYSTGVSIAYNAASGNTDSIAIRNGTLTNFGYGVITSWINGKVFLSDITVDHVVFNPSPPTNGNGGCGVQFIQVNSSTVNNCTFNGAYQGVLDQLSLGGNSYNNDRFNNVGYSLVLNPGFNKASIVLPIQRTTSAIIEPNRLNGSREATQV